MSNKKTSAFAFAAVALELASELSGMADSLGETACDNSNGADKYEAINYVLESLALITKNYVIELEETYEKHLKYEHIA